jgi:hypothetical protein
MTSVAGLNDLSGMTPDLKGIERSIQLHAEDLLLKTETAVIIALLILLPAISSADLMLGPEEYVLANGEIIDVPGFSVPSFVHWDGDSLRDLVIGQGSGAYPAAKVRVYLNTGTRSNPQFTDYFYAQSEGSDLTLTGDG